MSDKDVDLLGRSVGLRKGELGQKVDRMLGRRALEEPYARGQDTRERARQRGLAAQEELVAGAEEGLSRFDASAADRQRQIRFGAARGLAASAPSGRMAAGGGYLGAAGQAGLDAEMAGIRQAQSDEEKRFGLRQGIAQAELGAAEYAARAGSEEEEFASALAEGDADILKAINDKTDMIGNTDEEAVRLEREAVISRIAATNPRAARELRKRWSPGGERYNANASSFE